MSEQRYYQYISYSVAAVCSLQSISNSRVSTVPHYVTQCDETMPLM